jgi:aminoglycoside/choline kinase family phosphotransferase
MDAPSIPLQLDDTVLSNRLEALLLSEGRKLDGPPVALPSDLSPRRYWRLSTDQGPLLLMHCDPALDGSLPAFYAKARLLRDHGIPTPRCYGWDRDHGLLLLEDFGSVHLITSWATHQPSDVLEWYRQAIDLLVRLQTLEPEADWPRVQCSKVVQGVTEFIDHYIPAFLGGPLPAPAHEAFVQLWEDLFPSLTDFPRAVPVHYDYHAENLMMREDGSLGVIDFQDAMAGSPLYDVVSLLSDARVDVPVWMARQLLDEYISKTPWLDSKTAYTQYHLWGAQNNLRIMGRFAKRAQEDRRYQRYLQHLPRLAESIRQHLKHPLLMPLTRWMHEHLPSLMRV